MGMALGISRGDGSAPRRALAVVPLGVLESPSLDLTLELSPLQCHL